MCTHGHIVSEVLAMVTLSGIRTFSADAYFHSEVGLTTKPSTIVTSLFCEKKEVFGVQTTFPCPFLILILLI